MSSWRSRTPIRGDGDGRFVATISHCPCDCAAATIRLNKAPKGPDQTPFESSWRVSPGTKMHEAALRRGRPASRVSVPPETYPLPSRAPGPPSFASMKMTPAFSSAPCIASTVLGLTESPRSQHRARRHSGRAGKSIHAPPKSRAREETLNPKNRHHNRASNCHAAASSSRAWTGSGWRVRSVLARWPVGCQRRSPVAPRHCRPRVGARLAVSRPAAPVASVIRAAIGREPVRWSLNLRDLSRH
jgi:hypothetical protein